MFTCYLGKKANCHQGVCYLLNNFINPFQPGLTCSPQKSVYESVSFVNQFLRFVFRKTIVPGVNQSLICQSPGHPSAIRLQKCQLSKHKEELGCNRPLFFGTVLAFISPQARRRSWTLQWLLRLSSVGCAGQDCRTMH